jgi:hypothetical protein
MGVSLLEQGTEKQVFLCKQSTDKCVDRAEKSVPICDKVKTRNYDRYIFTSLEPDKVI